MKHTDIWDFIRKNLISLITILSGLASVVMNRFNILTDKDLLPIILTLIVLLATSEVISKSLKLEKIEDLILSKHNELIKSLQGVKVLDFTTSNKAYDFMSQQISASQESIFHCAMGNAVPLAQTPNNSFEKAMQKALKQTKVRYNYIAKLPNERRKKRIDSLLSDKLIKTYFVKEVNSDFDGFHNFMVFDNKTVIINFPYDYGYDEKFIFIEHPKLCNFIFPILITFGN